LTCLEFVQVQPNKRLQPTAADAILNRCGSALAFGGGDGATLMCEQ
jgi:hypothetical protein